MPLVRVYNDNYNERNMGQGNHPFVQEFKGVKYNIMPGKYVEMEKEEARDFLGTWSPITLAGNGQPDPRSFKMLRIQELTNEKSAPEPVSELKCQACGYEASSKEDLEEHIDANHLEQIQDQELAEDRRKKKK